MCCKDDPALGAVIQRSFKRMARVPASVRTVQARLTESLPTGERLNMPTIPELSEVFRVLGQPD